MKAKMLSAAVLAAVFGAGDACAQWNHPTTPGLGVIQFTSSNPRKIILTHNAEAGEAGRTILNQDFVDYRNAKEGAEIRNANSFLPGDKFGTAPGEWGTTYTPTQLRPQGATGGKWVYSHISRAQIGAECIFNGRCSVSVGSSIGTSSCVNHEIQIGASANYSGTFAKLDWLGWDYGISGSYTRGWSSCQTRSQQHYCDGVKIANMKTINFPVSENRSRIGYRTLTDTGTNSISFTTANAPDSAFRSKCQAAGGSYRSSYSHGRTPPFFRNECNDLAGKIKFDEYGYWPAAQQPVTNDCRVTGVRI